MAKLSTDELLDAFKEMTLIELSEFVKQFEDTFGVTAAAPVAVAAAPAAGGAGGGEDSGPDDGSNPQHNQVFRLQDTRKGRVATLAGLVQDKFY